MLFVDIGDDMVSIWASSPFKRDRSVCMMTDNVWEMPTKVDPEYILPLFNVEILKVVI